MLTREIPFIASYLKGKQKYFKWYNRKKIGIRLFKKTKKIAVTKFRNILGINEAILRFETEPGVN